MYAATYGVGFGTTSLLGDNTVMESVTGDSTVTPSELGLDSGGGDCEYESEEEDEAEEDELALEETVVSELELELEEELDPELLPVSEAPSRAAAPSGPWVSK